MQLKDKLEARKNDLYNKYLVALNDENFTKAHEIWGQIADLTFHIGNIDDSSGSSYMTKESFKILYPDKVGGTNVL
jgi:hypothetical protein